MHVHAELALSCREKDLAEKLEHFRTLLQKLPAENYNNLRWGLNFSAPQIQGITCKNCVLSCPLSPFYWETRVLGQLYCQFNIIAEDAEASDLTYDLSMEQLAVTR